MPTNDSQTLIWVDNENAAKSIYMMPGTTMFFMDKNIPRLYAKTTGLGGETSSFRMFNLVEVQPPEPAVDQNAFVTNADFSKAIEDLKSYIDSAVKRRNTRATKEA